MGEKLCCEECSSYAFKKKFVIRNAADMYPGKTLLLGMQEACIWEELCLQQTYIWEELCSQ